MNRWQADRILLVPDKHAPCVVAEANAIVTGEVSGAVKAEVPVDPDPVVEEEEDE